MTRSERDNSAKAKPEVLQIRLDTELSKRAREKANKNGWQLSAVIRALLHVWTERDIISGEDVGKAGLGARRGPKPKKTKSK